MGAFGQPSRSFCRDLLFNSIHRVETARLDGRISLHDQKQLRRSQGALRFIESNPLKLVRSLVG